MEKPVDGSKPFRFYLAETHILKHASFQHGSLLKGKPALMRMREQQPLTDK